MAKRPVERSVIKHANGLFLTTMEVVGYKDTIEVDTGNKDIKKVFAREIIKPAFHAVVKDHALKYATSKDASDMMAHSMLEDPKAFEGCTVESEYDD